MEEAIVANDCDDVVDLPPGFRFHPTDEEIITNYLTEKVKNNSFSSCAIGEVDLNEVEPWDLPKRAKMGEKECYFFCQRDRKYPTGMRTNRATQAGYWKATGKDKHIFRGKNCLVGMKKTLVFYKGRAPKGQKTNWVIHEYRLEGKFNYYTLVNAPKDEWVVCRVFHKSTGIKKTPIHELMRMNSFGDELLDYPSFSPLIELPSNMPNSNSFNMMNPNNNMQIPSTSYQKQIISSNLYQSQVQVPSSLFNFQNSQSLPTYNLQTSSIGGNERNEDFGLDKDEQGLMGNEKGFEGLEDPSIGQISDLERLWDY